MNKSRFEHKKPHPSLHKQYLSICDYNEFAKAICSRFAKYRLNLRISDVVRRRCLPFENTHEAIVDPETWKLAQRSRQTVRRTDTTGEANPLTGLLFCAECGARMYNHRSRGRALKEGWEPDPDSGLYPSDNYNCSTYMLTAKHSEQKCCSHYITTRAVRTLLLDTIKTVSTYAISDEKGFVEKIRAASQLRQDNAAKELKRKLNRDRKRSAELDGLIKKLYESFATGSLTEKRFKLLSEGYERMQEVDIYLKFIGKFDVPLPEPTPEELAEQERLRKKREKQREYSRRSREKKKRAAAQN